MRRVVSQGELRKILHTHALDPSKLSYRPLPRTVGREFWLSLDAEHRALYGADPDSLLPDPPTVGQIGSGTGRHMSFTLEPGSYNAWVVDG